MTIRNLYKMLETLAGGPGVQGIRNDSGSYNNPKREGQVVQIGTVVAVGSITGAVITVDGLTVNADLATDEPLRVGAQCWVSKTKEGAYVIHGSKK